jgi:hypothetical protein
VDDAEQNISHSRFVLTVEAEGYVTAGSAEVQLFNAVPAEGISLAELKVSQQQQDKQLLLAVACKVLLLG